MLRSRLTLLAAVAAILSCWAAQPAGAQDSAPPLRVYVVVLDGMKPGEVGPLTPMLAELKAQGTWYDEARAVFPAETLPNHAAMMTGFAPQTSGIVGNDFWIPNGGGASKYRMQYPNLLGADTLTTRLENSCTVSTATVQSKGYLWGLFRSEPPNEAEGQPVNHLDPNLPDPNNPGNQRQADRHWRPIGQPGYIPDPDDHAVDSSTMQNGFLPWVDENATPPQFAFVNLGDIDRSGHIDETGVNALEGLSAARRAALTDTDTQIRTLVQKLKDLGTWDETVLIFTSDHNMDWSPTDNLVGQFSVDITRKLQDPAAGYNQDNRGEPGATAGGNGDFNVVPGGGSAAVYVEDAEDIAPIAQIVDAIPGVAFVATRTSVPPLGNPTLAEMDMDHPNNGDVVAFVEKGYAIRDSASLNPLPGNHGHPATQQSVLLVTGGSSLLDEQPQIVPAAPGETVYAPAVRPFSPPPGGPGNLSVAPTTAALYGIGEPAGGYERGPLGEAFDPYALAAHTPCVAGQPVGRTISIDDQTVTEGTGGSTDAVFSVTVSPAPDVPLSVNFATATGTAGASDFGSRSGTLNFDIGEATETITVPVTGDTLDEPDEEFFVDLANATAGTIVDSRGTGTIDDDDEPPPTGPGDALNGSARRCAGRSATVTRSTARGRVTHAVGTPGPDVIVGTPGNDLIIGLGGNDLICGGRGDDLILGNRGNDVLRGNKDDDVIRGNGGPDQLWGNDGDDRLDGGRGRDRCLVGPGRDLAAPRGC